MSLTPYEETEIATRL